MGCSGSKTAGKASMPVAAETTEADFKIKIENPAGDADLGLVVQFPEKKYILVESLKEEGLIPSWNKASENTPEMQVKAGDRIVMINDKFGDSDAMMAECKATSMTLGVKRCCEVAATAADAQAAEATPTAAPSAEAPAAEDLTNAPVVEAPAGGAQKAEDPVVEVAVTEATAEPSAAVVEAPATEAAVAGPAAAAHTAEVSATAAVEESPVESPITEAPAEAPVTEAPAEETQDALEAELVATAPVTEAPLSTAAEDAPAAEAPAASAAQPAFCVEDVSVSVEPEPAEVGSGASVLQMCKWF